MNKKKDKLTYWLFLFPALLVFVLVIVIPFVLGTYYSFTNWDGIRTFSKLSFLGFENYKQVFTKDLSFIYAIILTFAYAFFNILAVNIVSFSIAMLVNNELKFKKLYRAGFFLPNLIGGLILGYVWQFIFNNAIPSFGGIIGSQWLMENYALGNVPGAVFAIVCAGTWQYAGYIMMIYLTALQNIPKSLIEAADMDGANYYYKLKNITIPLLAPAFTVTLFLTLVNSFKQFDVNISLTNGGPSTMFTFASTTKAINGTELLALNIYNEAYALNEMAIGQAKAIIFFMLLVTVALIQVYYNKKKEIEM